MNAYENPLTEDVKDQERLVADHIDLVKRIAYHFTSRSSGRLR